MIDKPQRDAQTVRPDGTAIQELIEGVRIRPAVTHQDDRGTVCEIFSAGWAFDDEPLVHIYQFTIRPQVVKGWGVHREHTDRYFFSSGSVKVVLYDDRADSPTHGMLNVLYFSEINRSLLVIPPGVYHATENIGMGDAVMINLPNRAYDYDAPDKYRLPIDTDHIPYRFFATRGG